MARLYHTFGDIEGKLDVLRVECIKCERTNVRLGQTRRFEHMVGMSALTQRPDLFEPDAAWLNHVC